MPFQELFYAFGLFAPIAVARSDRSSRNDKSIDGPRASEVSGSVLIPSTLRFGILERQAELTSQPQRLCDLRSLRLSCIVPPEGGDSERRPVPVAPGPAWFRQKSWHQSNDAAYWTRFLVEKT